MPGRQVECRGADAAAVEHSAIYAKCDDEVITHKMGVTDDPLQKFKGFVDLEKRSIDPVAMVGANLKIAEKAAILALEPCQPSENYLREKKKQIGDRIRKCSQQVFFHADGKRSQWVSYSTTKDSLFCVPCVLFNDGLRTQSNNFTSIGFSG